MSRDFRWKLDGDCKEKHEGRFFISLLKKVDMTYSNDKIVMLVDNGRLHHSGKVLGFLTNKNK